jgi:NTE family protein
MKRMAVAGLVAASLVAAPTPAQAEPPAPARPKVVLVLSGGGARGSAHIGVIKVLEEYHVPIDLVVGTSMGSIVGGLYASGWSVDEIEDKITTIDWGSVFVDKLQRQDKTFRRKAEDARFLIPIKMRFKNWKPYLPSAVIGGQNLELLFQGLAMEATGETDFDRFPIPYRAVATDLTDGRAVVIGRGSLATAMRASMSLPGIFPPVELDGKPLSDGGMAANFPIRIARSMGADVVIGVDITSPLRKKEQLGNLLTRIDQVTSLLTNANKEEDMNAVVPRDVILVPDLGDITFSDFAKAAETIRRGETAARDAEAKLRALSVPDAEWAAYMARHHRRHESELVVDKVVIENTGPLSDEIVHRRIVVPTGKPLDSADLSKQLTRLYGLDVFGAIQHDFQRTDGEGGVLKIQVPPKPYGRNSLQFGFFISNDFKGDLGVDLTVSHLVMPVNRAGGEWRNTFQFGTHNVAGTEYYQPLDPSMAWYFYSQFRYRRNQVRFFSADGDALAEYSFTSLDGSAAFGRVFGRWGELRAGAYRSSGKGSPRIGVAAFSTLGSEDGGLYARFVVDTLDSTTWPRHGTEVTADYRQSLTSFGAEESGEFASLRIGQAMTLGRNVVFLSIEAQNIFDGLAVIDNVATFGGFLRLSGLHEDQLIGTKGGLTRLMYYRELTKFNLGSMTQRMYAGFSLEAGGVYDTGDPVSWPSLRRAGSIFVGADTVLGPAYLGYGYEESGQQSAYIIIGRRF